MYLASNLTYGQHAMASIVAVCSARRHIPLTDEHVRLYWVSGAPARGTSRYSAGRSMKSILHHTQQVLYPLAQRSCATKSEYDAKFVLSM